MARNEKTMEEIFEEANERFIRNNVQLFDLEVAERTLCGALMLELHEVKKGTEYSNYFVDVEFNRSNGGRVKTMLPDGAYKNVNINCDLVVHGRGTDTPHENLITIEMKKADALEKDKESDKVRLMTLTKMPREGVWSYNGEADPENVCGYLLGIYYEIDFKRKVITIEYYQRGKIYRTYEINY